MEPQAITSASHAVLALQLPIVFVTKYRRKILHPETQDSLRGTFEEILLEWRCSNLAPERIMSICW